MAREAPPTIRDHRPGDRAALVRFMGALQDFERTMEENRLPGAAIAASHLDALLAWVGEHPGGGCLVAERDGEPMGFAVFGVETEMGTYVPEATRTHGVVSDLWVEPGARGGGVATALVRAAEARLAAHGLLRVEITALAGNAAALALYRRLGYAASTVTLARGLAVPGPAAKKPS